MYAHVAGRSELPQPRSVDAATRIVPVATRSAGAGFTAGSFEGRRYINGVVAPRVTILKTSPVFRHANGTRSRERGKLVSGAIPVGRRAPMRARFRLIRW